MRIAIIIITLVFFGFAGYYWYKKPVSSTAMSWTDTLKSVVTLAGDSAKADPLKSVITSDSLPAAKIIMGNMPVDSIVEFAKTLIGTPYLYGSTDPVHGFDCSGFITYVFNHFKINVPRSSVDFTNVGREIPLAQSQKGDLILFTGTDSTEKFVGHMGIIVTNQNGAVEFIHSSSGKANGVVITPLNTYYLGRFVKVIRL